MPDLQLIQRAGAALGAYVSCELSTARGERGNEDPSLKEFLVGKLSLDSQRDLPSLTVRVAEGQRRLSDSTQRGVRAEDAAWREHEQRASCTKTKAVDLPPTGDQSTVRRAPRPRIEAPEQDALRILRRNHHGLTTDVQRHADIAREDGARRVCSWVPAPRSACSNDHHAARAGQEHALDNGDRVVRLRQQRAVARRDQDDAPIGADHGARPVGTQGRRVRAQGTREKACHGDRTRCGIRRQAGQRCAWLHGGWSCLWSWLRHGAGRQRCEDDREREEAKGGHRGDDTRREREAFHPLSPRIAF